MVFPSSVSVPLLYKTRPQPMWKFSSGIHIMSGILYSQVMGKIWTCVVAKKKKERLSSDLSVL